MQDKWLAAVAVIACISLTTLAGCGKGSDVEHRPEKPSTGQGATSSSGQTEPAKDGKAGQGAERAGKTSGTKGEDEEEAEQVKLDVELPEPTFAGTPSDLKGMHLDPDAGGPRGAVYAPEGVTLLSKGKPVSTSSESIMGQAEQVTDGIKKAGEGFYLTLPAGKEWVQVDLGNTYKLDAILIWHYHASARVYHDVIVQVSGDKDFKKNVRKVFNNDYDNSSGLGKGDNYEYVETYEGKLVKPGGVKGSYVRVYTNGSTANELNHFTEVEIYGRPATD